MTYYENVKKFCPYSDLLWKVPEIQGDTRAPVLRRGGRTTSGLALGLGSVKSVGFIKRNRPLPFCQVD